MTCLHCQTWNSDYEHRCARCARRLYESAPLLEDSYDERAERYDRGTTAVLMSSERHGGGTAVAEPERMLRHLAPESVAYDVPPDQGGLLPASRTAHQLIYVPRSSEDLTVNVTQAQQPVRTSIEAVIFSDAPLAHPVHRALAFSLDASLVTIAAGLFVMTLHFGGFGFSRQPLTMGMVGGAIGLIVALYQFLWAAAGTDSPGMQWTHMQLLNFEGNRPTRGQRMARLVGRLISTLSCGLGLIWSAVDEEGLSWHDHLSRTFPSIRPVRR